MKVVDFCVTISARTRTRHKMRQEEENKTSLNLEVEKRRRKPVPIHLTPQRTKVEKKKTSPNKVKMARRSKTLTRTCLSLRVWKDYNQQELTRSQQEHHNPHQNQENLRMLSTLYFKAGQIWVPEKRWAWLQQFKHTDRTKLQKANRIRSYKIIEKMRRASDTPLDGKLGK